MSEDVRPFDFIFIVAMGRSGSTVVQGVMNAVPGVTIYGEDYLSTVRLLQGYAGAKRASDEHKWISDVVASPWYGAYLIDVPAVARGTGAIIRQQMGSAVTLGRKEIRWGDLSPDDIPGLIDAAHDVLGRVGWVLHDRDFDQIRKSGWWSVESPRVVAEAHDRHATVSDAIAHSTDDFLRSHYDEVEHDFDQWSKNVLTWMGIERSDDVIPLLHAAKEVRYST